MLDIKEYFKQQAIDWHGSARTYEAFADELREVRGQYAPGSIQAMLIQEELERCNRKKSKAQHKAWRYANAVGLFNEGEKGQ